MSLGRKARPCGIDFMPRGGLADLLRERAKLGHSTVDLPAQKRKMMCHLAVPALIFGAQASKSLASGHRSEVARTGCGFPTVGCARARP